ncbi:hypothetical protein NGM37_16245, partial [Streptomyces sp. TRM76130]|nr:hypothetical protein [Streptomyces sp. TRM76130]
LGTVAVAAPLAGRERSLPGIAALLAFGQTALHALFGVCQYGAATAGTAATAPTTDATLAQQAARLVCGTTAA